MVILLSHTTAQLGDSNFNFTNTYTNTALLYTYTRNKRDTRDVNKASNSSKGMPQYDYEHDLRVSYSS